MEIPPPVYQQKVLERLGALNHDIVGLQSQVEVLTAELEIARQQLRDSDASDELETPLSDLELDDGTKVDARKPVPPSNEPEED